MKRTALNLAGTTWIAVVLLGCQTGMVRDETSPRFVVPVGSRIVLERPVDIPPGSARVYIQGERMGGYGQMNKFQPFCDLEFRDLAPRGRTIEPAGFEVVRVERRLSDFDLSSHSPLVAARGWALFSGDAPSLTYITEMWLKSSDYPRVMRLSCKETFDPSDIGRHLSIRDIRQTLAPAMRLELPPEAE